MGLLYAAVLAAVGANAFPNMMMEMLEPRDVAKTGCTVSKACDTYYPVSDSQAGIGATPNAAQKLSAARSNCGQDHVCVTFDAKEQYVSTSGTYAYVAPKTTDIRGPCPGLNAAANHGYLPHNGLATIPQTVAGLGQLYGMSPDLSGFLAAYAIAFDGDVVSGQWSIGGRFKTLTGGVTGYPEGISYSHNNYEGDTSIGRCDAYINGGDAHSLSLTRFGYPYSSPQSKGSYTLDGFSRTYAKNTIRSIKTNPYYFAPLFSTTLVSPAAYNFVINFMSNHSAAQPAGYLDGSQFKTWFAVSGSGSNPSGWTWKKGQERIPNNWYRRSSTQQYNAGDVFGDLAVEFAAYPATFRFGGNTGGTNTYTGIDIGNFTGGVYNAGNLFTKNNLGCFFFQNFQQAFPQQLEGILKDPTKAASAYALIQQYWPPFFTSLTCPALGKYDASVFQKYTGNSYSPTGSFNGPQNC